MSTVGTQIAIGVDVLKSDESNSVQMVDVANCEQSATTSFLQLAMSALRLTTVSTLKTPSSDYNNNNTLRLRKQITLDEVSYHDTYDDCWIVLYDRVYDITNFLALHPGGYDVLLENAGRDATIAFVGTGHSKAAIASLKIYEIGELPQHECIYRCVGKLRTSILPD